VLGFVRTLPAEQVSGAKNNSHLTIIYLDTVSVVNHTAQRTAASTQVRSVLSSSNDQVVKLEPLRAHFDNC
jgi:hypothetical protein